VLGGAITPVDDGLIPTGARLPVDGTPFDLRDGPLLADALDALSGTVGGGTVGFDHNWCLDGGTGELRPVARLDHPPTGRRLELLSNQPGLQVYTGGYLNAAIIGKDGQPYRPFAGIALETQRFPNSPNIGDFPSARLDPGRRYEHRMELRVTAGA
jgi:aldose 1-epimerase